MASCSSNKTRTLKQKIKFWEKEYGRVKNNAKKILMSKKIDKRNNIVVAFNANIDAIINLKKSNENLLENEIKKCGIDENSVRKEAQELREIHTKEEFLEALLYSVWNSQEVELRTSSNDVLKYVSKNFKVNEKRIGGQAGIVASLYSQFPSSVIFYSSTLGRDIVKHLPLNIDFLTPNGVMKKKEVMKESNVRNKEGRKNYIFEYDKNFELLGRKATHHNRFILATRAKDDVYFGSAFDQEVFKRTSKFFLSGYHHINRENLNDLKKASKELKEIRRLNDSALIHVEDAHLQDRKVKRVIIENIWKRVHSVGLNEYELAQSLRSLNFLRYKKYVREKMNVESSIKALAYLLKKTRLKRIALHTYNFQVHGFSLNLLLDTHAIRDHIMLSYLLGSTKATRNDFKLLNNVRNVNGNINYTTIGCLKDLENSRKFEFMDEGIFLYKNFVFVVVPSLTSRRIKYSVGLGDVVSSTTFYLW